MNKQIEFLVVGLSGFLEQGREICTKHKSTSYSSEPEWFSVLQIHVLNLEVYTVYLTRLFIDESVEITLFVRNESCILCNVSLYASDISVMWKE